MKKGLLRLAAPWRQGAALLLFAMVSLGVYMGIRHLFAAIPHAGLGIDDANIFFVYARNLRQGFGLVYNAGGERVEGFTSPAWVLIGAAAFFFRSPERMLLLFNAVLCSFTLTALALHLARGERGGKRGVFVPLGALLMLAWVFTAPEYFSWCIVSLMETGLWSASLIFCIITLSGAACGGRAGRILFPASPALLLLVRPESMVWGAGFVALYFLLVLLGTGRARIAIRHALPPALVYLAVLTALTSFRLLYFGFPFPNTYYAKVSPDRLYSLQEGWNYFTAFLETHGWIPWLLTGAALVAGGWTLAGGVQILRRRTLPLNKWDVTAYISAASVLVGMAIPIWVGGDHFASFRFYQPIWPLLPIPLAYLAARGLQVLFQRAERLAPSPALRIIHAVLTLFLTLLATASFLHSNNARWNALEKTELHVDFEVAHDGRLFADMLNQLFEGIPTPSVGAITAGGFKFVYEGEVVDLMGLNNVAMGHAPGERKGIKNHAAFNKEVFYQLQPELLPLLPVTPEVIGASLTWEHPQVQRCVQHRWLRQPLHDIFLDPEFQEAYALVYLSRNNEPETPGVLAFAKQTFIHRLKECASLSILEEEPSSRQRPRRL
ncbi:MAG: hypothetical protein PHG65_06845 [Kiritimatiellae bacterium]|nr:hypothetical protein [Kiritimatiellia bacterium]